MSMDLGATPAAVVGEQTARTRVGARRRRDVKAVIGGIAGVASLTAAVVLWATGALEAKASTNDVAELRGRAAVVEPRLTRVEADLAWLKADSAWLKQVLWQMAQKDGIHIAPPTQQEPERLEPLPTMPSIEKGRDP
jgi:hypothetical protein